MINILYVSWTEKMSGGEISILNYIRHLDKSRFRPMLLCPENGKLTEAASGMRMPVFFMKMEPFSFKRPWKFFISLFRLVNIIKKEKIDLMHCTTFYSNQLAVAAGKICRVPVVTHGQSFLTGSQAKRNLLRFSSRIIACSESVKRNVLQHTKIKKELVDVMLHAVEIPSPGKKTYALHKELGIPKEYSIIGHIGLIEERKRQEDTIRAAKTVLEKYKKVKFVIAGDARFNTESYQENLRRITHDLGIDDDVIFLGFRENINDLMNDLDIIVLPSIDEPFALVMIEAMALAKPFIGADSGGTPELISDNHNGLLIKPKDHKSLAKHMIFLLKNKDQAKKIGLAGRRSIIERCNIDDYASRLSSLYDDLCKGVQRRGLQ